MRWPRRLATALGDAWRAWRCSWHGHDWEDLVEWRTNRRGILTKAESTQQECQRCWRRRRKPLQPPLHPMCSSVIASDKPSKIHYGSTRKG